MVSYIKDNYNDNDNYHYNDNVHLDGHIYVTLDKEGVKLIVKGLSTVVGQREGYHGWCKYRHR